MALRGQQFFVPALLDDPAVLYDEDEIRVLDGGQSVGDHDGRAPADDRIDGSLDLLLRERIDRGGRLVEHNDLRLRQDGPGEGDQLFFAGGQHVAALSHVGIQTLFELRDDAFRRYEPDRFPDLLFRRVRTAVHEVFAYGAGEQVRRLQHVAQRRVQPKLRTVSGVAPVDQQAALRRLVEPVRWRDSYRRGSSG